MIRLTALLLMTGPALAEPPFAVGQYVVQTQLFDMASGAALPNPVPPAQRACFRVEAISDTNLQLRLVAGYLDSLMPGMPPPPKNFNRPRHAPIGTGTSHGASTGLWSPCEAPDPTGYRTVSTTCDMGRFYAQVPDCTGRPIPMDEK